MWIAMVFIMLLFFLSIYGAFAGAEKAKEFFNSVPLAIYWASFISLLALGIVLFRRLFQVPALLFMHFGCILILLGGIWSSQSGHILQKNIFRINKVPSGIMQIYEGEMENRVLTEQDDKFVLPFSVGLKDFRIEYYEPGNLYIRTQNKVWKYSVEEGMKITPDKDFGTIEILKVFENFKRTKQENGEIIVVDDPAAGSNPALEVQVTPPDGKPLRRYVFSSSIGYMYPDNFSMVYERDIKEFISDLQVIKDNKVIAQKNIEVNHPLHYGGYHFYQQDYDHQAGKYTILKVTSDSGLFFVYAGFLTLCIGVCWNFWITKLGTKGR